MKSPEGKSKHVIIVGEGTVGLRFAFELIECAYHVTLSGTTVSGSPCLSGKSVEASRALSVAPSATPAAFKGGLKVHRGDQFGDKTSSGVPPNPDHAPFAIKCFKRIGVAFR